MYCNGALPESCLQLGDGSISGAPKHIVEATSVNYSVENWGGSVSHLPRTRIQSSQCSSTYRLSHIIPGWCAYAARGRFAFEISECTCRSNIRLSGARHVSFVSVMGNACRRRRDPLDEDVERVRSIHADDPCAAEVDVEFVSDGIQISILLMLDASVQENQLQILKAAAARQEGLE